MPHYEFECKACETRFDVERPMREASAPATCPFCERPARRVFTVPQFAFGADRRSAPSGGPTWHSHGGYGHTHAPGRGFHGRPPR